MKKTLFVWILLLSITSVFGAGGKNKTSPQKTITGIVTDKETNEPLIGCTVTQKGTTNGVTTNVEGKFSINATTDNPVLVFDFIGYEKQEVAVGNRTSIEVKLVSTTSQLSEVIVIGYGNTSSKDVTGSAKSIKSDAFNKGIIASPEQLLQGKAAGVNITASSGEPGAASNISIRGPGGVRTGSTPLFVVDGFALDNSSVGGATNPLAFINPDDIASIDVLKDASATAIYGARGANGVILITTKKGKSGASNLTYTTSLGLSKIARPLDVFTADEFRTQMKQISGSFVDDGGNTDWQKEVTQQAFTQNHNLSLSGGSDKLTYFGSFGLQKQEGIIRNSNLDRYSGRVNVNQKLWDDKLNIEVNLSASRTNNVRPDFQGVIGSAISANPTYKPFNADGTLKFYPDGSNPMLSLSLYKDQTFTNRFLGNISPSLTLAKGLVYKLNYGVDNSTTARDIQTMPNKDPFVEGGLQTINTYNTNTLIENYITYTLDKNSHSLTALVGHSFQKIKIQGRAYSINRFPTNGIEPIYNPGLGQDLNLANNRPTGYAILNELQSFFSRVNYQFKDKYLATATLRVDGSSKFGANNKYGVFPSFSLGWRLSEEPFIKSISKISDLKLRAGWGLTGNQEIPSKITQARFTSSVTGTTSYPIDNSTTFPAGTTYSRLANPNIQWEVSNQIDLGLDFGFFNNSITGSIDYFNKVSQDILLEVIPADPVQPAGTFWTNVPNMRIINKGLEIDLNYRKSVNKNFRYEIGGNMTFIRNNVQNSPYSVIPSGSASGPGLTSATINGYINNQPIGTFYLREFIGLDENGLSKYRDVNGDGVVTDNDRIAAGTALPTMMYNINGTLGYKGFDLVANFNGVSGNKVYDNTANANFYKLRLSKGVNTTAEAIQFPNESLSNSAPVSTRFLKNGAFFRLNNVSLGYTINTKALGISKYISTARLSLTGQNLFVITDYNGYDPDVNTDRSVNGILSYGIDYLTYPKAKTIIFGLNLGF